jgi:hypothetical protein
LETTVPTLQSINKKYGIILPFDPFLECLDGSVQNVCVLLQIESYGAIKGGLSDQDVSVLSTKYLQGTEGDLDQYIEFLAGSARNFIAKLYFASELLPQPIQEICITTNMIGLAKVDQRRFFQIRNFGSKAWEYVGTMPMLKVGYGSNKNSSSRQVI